MNYENSINEQRGKFYVAQFMFFIHYLQTYELELMGRSSLSSQRKQVIIEMFEGAKNEG